MSGRLSMGLKSLHNALAGAELAFSVSFSMILLNSTICKTLSFMEIVILPVKMMIDFFHRFTHGDSIAHLRRFFSISCGRGIL